MEGMYTMRWEAPMQWSGDCQAATDPHSGKPQILRILGIPGAARMESVFAVLRTDGVTKFLAPTGESPRRGLVDAIGSFDFLTAWRTAKPFKAPRSPIAGQITTPSGSGSAVGGDILGGLVRAIEDGIMPKIDAKVEDALDGVEERIKAAVAAAAERPIVIKVGEAKEVKCDGTEHSRFRDMVSTLAALPSADRNVLLFGERGSGKSTAAKQYADKIGLPFGAVSFSAGVSESMFTGRFLPSAGGEFRWRPTPFTRLYTEGGVFCLDELDKADPQVATALNMALANGEIVTAEGEVLKRHADFVAIGGANSLRFSKQYAAAQPQDGSLLDRFAMIEWNICPTLLRNVIQSIAGHDKGGRILRIRDAVNAALAAKRFTDWSVGMRTARRMAHSTAAGLDPIDGSLRDEVAAMAPQYMTECMAAARGA
jgi:MoxR-like ATPase